MDSLCSNYKMFKYGLYLRSKPLKRNYWARAFAPETISKISLVIAA